MSVQEKISEILTNHNLMHIATINADGHPAVRGVDFVKGVNEQELYFLTRKDSNKVAQINENCNVSIAIDHDCPTKEDLMQLYYLKATATAEIVTNPTEANHAMGLLMQKLPFLTELPGEKEDFLVGKVTLKEVSVTDNRVNFGHTEVLAY